MPPEPDHMDAATGETRDQDRLRRLKGMAMREFRQFLYLFLYLWLILGLFVLNERIILGERHINFTAQGFAFVNALILAKVMLVVEGVNPGRWLDTFPRIYGILYDSFVLAVLFIVFHILEKLIIGLVHGEALATSVPAIGGGGMAGLACVAVILFIVMIPRFGFRAVSEALGPGGMRRFLFHPREDSPFSGG